MYQTILSEIRNSIPFELGNDVWNIIYEMLNVKHPICRHIKILFAIFDDPMYKFEDVEDYNEVKNGIAQIDLMSYDVWNMLIEKFNFDNSHMHRYEDVEYCNTVLDIKDVYYLLKQYEGMDCYDLAKRHSLNLLGMNSKGFLQKEPDNYDDLALTILTCEMMKPNDSEN